MTAFIYDHKNRNCANIQETGEHNSSNTPLINATVFQYMHHCARSLRNENKEEDTGYSSCC